MPRKPMSPEHKAKMIAGRKKTTRGTMILVYEDQGVRVEMGSLDEMNIAIFENGNPVGYYRDWTDCLMACYRKIVRKGSSSAKDLKELSSVIRESLDEIKRLTRKV